MIGSVILAISLTLSSSGTGWKNAEIAPWYGYGFYGNRTACGQRLTRSIVGVAHRTLPCGSRVRLVWKGRSIIAKVIDRGPYPARRLRKYMPFDLTAGTAKALGCNCDNPYFTRHDVRYRVLS